jgi:hypothetical protein
MTMKGDVEVGDQQQTRVRVSVSIVRAHEEHGNKANVEGDLPGLLGNLVFDLLGAVGLSRETTSKANIRMVEELSNAIEVATPWEGELKVAFAVENGQYNMAITAPPAPRRETAADSWFPADTDTDPRVNVPNQTIRRAKAQLAATVQERRVDRRQGGLGLVRLGAEAHQRSKKPGGDDGEGGEGGSSAPAAADAPLPEKP